jgi:uncharacterized protein YjbI with pentapeptide repeats
MIDWKLVIIIFIAIICLLIWWFLPYFQVQKLSRKQDLTAKDIAELEDEFRKTVTQALGGAIIFLSVAVAFAQLIEARRSSEAQLRESARATDINKRAQLLAKGVELLGEKSSAERMAGIRILHDWAERPFKDDTSSKESRYSLLTVALISFVREWTDFEVEAEECEKFWKRRPKSHTVEVDVQEALNILRDISTDNPVNVNFRALNLSRADLSGADLSGSSFAFADLSEADLSNTILENTNFYCTNLYRANLAGANLSSDVPEEPGPLTNMVSAYLVRANLEKVNGRVTDLFQANLAGANLAEATLVETNLRGTKLWEVNFFRTKLDHVQIDNNTDLDKACLVETIVESTPLKEAKNYENTITVESGNQLDIKVWCAPKRTGRD